MLKGMSNYEILLETYHRALLLGRCKNKGDFARLLGITGTTLSRAFAQNEKYLTPILIDKLQKLHDEMDVENLPAIAHTDARVDAHAQYNNDILSRENDETTVKGRLLKYIHHLGIPVSAFEKQCGMSNATIANMRKSLAQDKVENIARNYPDLNITWLMTGEGEMLNVNPKAEEDAEPQQNTATLPLVPIAAVAGYSGLDEVGVTLAECPQYSVPDFFAVNAEFLIRVSGSSMYPKYSSGDILACRRIREITFLQWGKIYVIDSQQGMMVKRLFEIDGEPGLVLCKSDNENYPPFRLPKEEIRSLSIVVGAIRLE